MSTDYRALCAELHTAVQLYTGQNPAAAETPANELVARLMAALAATATALAQPEPEEVTDEEIEREALKNADSDDEYRAFKSGAFFVQERMVAATPQPSPVPEPEGVTEKQVMDLADDCAFDRQEISGFDGGRTFHGHGWECTDEQLVTFATELLTRYARHAIEPVSEVLTDEAIEELTWRHTCEIGDLGVGVAVEDAPAFIRAALARWGHPTTEPVPVAERFEFSVFNSEYEEQAGGTAPTYAEALSYGQHYLSQYSQDGPHSLEIRRVEVLPHHTLPLPTPTP